MLNVFSISQASGVPRLVSLLIGVSTAHLLTTSPQMANAECQQHNIHNRILSQSIGSFATTFLYCNFVSTNRSHNS